MKKTLTILAFLVFNIFSYAQNTNKIPEPNIDSMLVNINKTALTSSFLYDRVTQLANLTQFNKSNNTATIGYFEQAIQELFNASNHTKFKSLENVRKHYKIHNRLNKVEIGIINVQFQSLNINNKDKNEDALKVENQMYSKINGKPIFKNNDVLILAPLKQYAVGETINYSLNPNLWFEDSNNPIKSIAINFDTGKVYNYTKIDTTTKISFPITYLESGYKTLTFKVNFKDGTTKTTYGKLHVKLPKTSMQRMNEGAILDTIHNSTLSFPNYNETTPIAGKLEYSIYYHTLNNESEQRILLKPIVIIDGFDPLDRRKIQDDDSPLPDGDHTSLEEFMTYKDGVFDTPIIPLLRNLGYDVILVNQPTHYKNVNGVIKTIDGGADYIERNALAHVSLYSHLNATLFANNSSEELVIVGPSMGGQISRYALAYMEKNNIDHNTRLWVSIDSPHLGANIPMGIQSMIDLLAGFGGSAAAQDFYFDQLKSTAAKQQVISQHKTGQSSDYLNGGSPFFQQYYNNLNTNGLPGSNGYPQNLRRIAIVNGSITGKHLGTAGEEDFRIHGFADGFLNNVDIKVAEMNTNYMPTTGGTKQVARLWRLGKPTRTATYTNNSIYGSLDVLPGGYFNSENQIHASVMGASPDIYSFNNGISFGNLIAQAYGFQLLGITGDHFESRTNKKIHTFIPTVSALGFTNPEFNWGEYIDSNLLCSDDIPFDSFYAPKINEQHTSFTEESVNWLLAELAGNPQPINGSPNSTSEFLTGPSTLNECQTRQYIAPFVHKVNNYVWTLSGDNSGYCDWEIVSGQGNRIVTIRAGKGFGVLTCRPQNSCGTGTLFYKNLHGNEVDEDDCGPQLRISPNPNKGEDISIVLKLPPNDPCNQFRNNNEKIDFTKYKGDNLWIYDFYGNLIYKSLEIKNETIINNNLISKTGIYLIKRLDQYGKTHIGKLIKE
ncbi:T9SS type A sorting domain-containing protein [Lacinutrix jangbogonensis]|uniref:T9SS type A sorting domain-containing protein n=1 Tax=Lacinutrix jangbogonensis TaxID=1469557 RepID=UPI00053DD185|nr:T9SS type A sorting domain-containing protein [Lacinutrix jangbogonensis]